VLIGAFYGLKIDRVAWSHPVNFQPAKLHKIAVLNALDKTEPKNISPKNNTFVTGSGNFLFAENLVDFPLFQFLLLDYEYKNYCPLLPATATATATVLHLHFEN